MDDSILKCGVSGISTGTWFIWACESEPIPVELMSFQVE